MEWRIHPAAQLEHDEWIEYFGGIDDELAVAFELRFLQCRRLICDEPELYRLRRGGVRRANLGPRFTEYYVAYMVWSHCVIILAVAHAKRRPFYWSSRVGDADELI
jgi:plasmid stabilization system protein ParE